jgi:hypothetical protein
VNVLEHIRHELQHELRDRLRDLSNVIVATLNRDSNDLPKLAFLHFNDVLALTSVVRYATIFRGFRDT